MISIFFFKKKLAFLAGFTQLYWYGQEGDFNIMIMDLLGPSLNDLFEYCNKKFSLKTVLMLADQMVFIFFFEKNVKIKISR